MCVTYLQLSQTHVCNYVFYFRSCGTIPGFWTGGCVSIRKRLTQTAIHITDISSCQDGNTARNAQLVSLYYSFTADTTTNLMSKSFPHIPKQNHST